MHNLYKWLLPIPILIIFLGIYLLLTGEAIIRNKYQPVPQSQNDKTEENNQRPNENIPSVETAVMPDTFSADLKSNRDSAYSYCLLGAGLLLILCVLPRLGELSLSPTSGISLKILSELQETVAEVSATTQAVAFKAKEISSPPSLLQSQASDLAAEINKLEVNRAKLETYTTMLQKITAGNKEK